MSTSLYWRPTSGEEYLGYDLKWALAERLWGHDGSLGGEWVELDHSFIPFLEGVAAGGNKEREAQAKKLITLIEMHGSVQIALLG